LLVYASSWIKCWYPDVFACAILNSQPMGFYSSAQLVRDAKEHGVEVRPVDVMHSEWDCTLETVEGASKFALRLGFRQLRGMNKDDANAIVEARTKGNFAAMRSVWLRAGLSDRALETLAKGDAWNTLKLNRRGALWAAKGLGLKPLPLFAAAEGAEAAEPPVILPSMSMGQEVTEDYRHLRLSLKCHPMALLRRKMSRQGVVTAEKLWQMPNGRSVRVAGIVTHRQRPGTASGVVFVTLEDETGSTNLIVWRSIVDSQRDALLSSRLMIVEGELQHADNVTNVVVRRIHNCTHWLGRLQTSSRNFH